MSQNMARVAINYCYYGPRNVFETTTSCYCHCIVQMGIFSLPQAIIRLNKVFGYILLPLELYLLINKKSFSLKSSISLYYRMFSVETVSSSVNRQVESPYKLFKGAPFLSFAH